MNDLWRIYMSAHTTQDGWSSVDSLPAFYVHAPTSKIAIRVALLVTRTVAAHTTGTCIRVDEHGLADESTYDSWERSVS